MANPVKMTVMDLGDSVNSPYADYSPVVSAEQSVIFFTSRRFGDMKITPDSISRLFTWIIIRTGNGKKLLT